MAEVAAQARISPDSIVGEIDQPGIGAMLAAAAPWRWDEVTPPARPAPTLSADTEAVLSDVLGLTCSEVSRLRVSGVV